MFFRREGKCTNCKKMSSLKTFKVGFKLYNVCEECRVLKECQRAMETLVLVYPASFKRCPGCSFLSPFDRVGCVACRREF
jgi:hypothetical protein